MPELFFFAGLGAQIEAFHLIPDAGAGYSEQLGRLGLIAAGFPQGLDESLLFQLIQAYRRVEAG
jgi:hypothetical protein